jgi:hypothetical protein
MKVTVLLLTLACAVTLASDNLAAASPVFDNRKSAFVSPPSLDAITIPQMLSYQGKLTDTFGLPVTDTTYSVDFRLYTQPTGGSPFWNENQNMRTRGGLFSTLLGSVTPIGTVPDAGTLYLGMAVAGGAELTPRLRIASAAYAYLSERAADADLLQGKDTTALDSRYVNEGQASSVTSNMIVDGTIAAADLDQMGAASGHVMKWTGSAWAPRNDSVEQGGTADNAWVRGTPDSVLYTVRPLGIARSGSTLYGNTAFSHVNLGTASFTGVSGYNFSYCTVGGGNGNKAPNDFATVGGGQGNTALASGSAVAGGESNHAAGYNSTIGGGHLDTVTYTYGTVSGGHRNVAAGFAATVSGGEINAAGELASVGGGQYNNARSAPYASIGGGYGNNASDTLSVIGGGMSNRVTGSYAVVGGGGHNLVSGGYGVVGGGYSDTASGAYATVGGGYTNTASQSYATVSGGRLGIASGTWSTVGGGYLGTASGSSSTVGGGYASTASGYIATVGGGWGNVASGYIATLAGGRGNQAGGDYSTVAGGMNDSAKGTYGGVLSGYSNLAGSAAADTAAVVCGGYDNSARGPFASVGGGFQNTASGHHATVAGGGDNTASGVVASVGGGGGNTASGGIATVGGGQDNTASGDVATVGGGGSNQASGQYATIGGGYGNAASGYRATVAGGTFDTSAANYSFTTNAYSVVPSSYDYSAAFNGQTATASNQTRVGVLSKASGTFTIDHPLDPSGKILNHYFIEGPEMLNIYRGSVVLSAAGRAEVNLPDYFDALNRNPMVQLTGVGTREVIYVADDVSGNRFAIGGPAGAKVYWQVTGERQDVSAEITRRLMPVEQPKTGVLAGTMLDDDFLRGAMDQLVRESKAQGIDFRTAAGRQRYEKMKQMTDGK